SALRKWVHRFAHQGTQGLVDRPRPGQPRKVTCELEQHLNRLVDQDPLQHGSLYSQWSCRELATVFARETGVQLGRESVDSYRPPEHTPPYGRGFRKRYSGAGEGHVDGRAARALTTKQEGQIMANYRVISSDNHVFEPPDLWTSRARPAFKDRVPQ